MQKHQKLKQKLKLKSVHCTMSKLYTTNRHCLKIFIKKSRNLEILKGILLLETFQETVIKLRLNKKEITNTLLIIIITSSCRN